MELEKSCPKELPEVSAKDVLCYCRVPRPANAIVRISERLCSIGGAGSVRLYWWHNWAPTLHSSDPWHGLA